MKTKILPLFLLILCSTTTFAARHPYVRTEEGVELMELVARFADNSVDIEWYKGDVLSLFDNESFVNK